MLSPDLLGTRPEALLSLLSPATAPCLDSACPSVLACLREVAFKSALLFLSALLRSFPQIQNNQALSSIAFQSLVSVSGYLVVRSWTIAQQPSPLLR
jgi:hypothetical protein